MHRDQGSGVARTARLFLASALFAAVGGAALADVEIERALDLSPGGKLVVDTHHGTIRVAGVDGAPAVTIRADRDDFEEHYRVDVGTSGEGAYVRVERRDRASGWFGRRSSDDVRIEIDVTVPRETAVDVDTAGGAIEVKRIEGPVRADTSGGSIRVADVAGDVLADTAGGGITVENIRGEAKLDTSGGSISAFDVQGAVRADTSGGSIRIERVTGDVEADTSGGSIEISDVGGRVEADTSGGSVSVAFAPGNDRGGEISASGGGIRVRVDPSVALTIDASSSAGRVRCDLPLDVRQRDDDALEGDLNGGGARLEVDSSAGSVRIEPL